MTNRISRRGIAAGAALLPSVAIIRSAQAQPAQ